MNALYDGLTGHQLFNLFFGGGIGHVNKVADDVIAAGVGPECFGNTHFYVDIDMGSVCRYNI